MTRFIARIILPAIVAALALATAAEADDTDLFLRSDIPPNMLIILDSSQSMTWFDQWGDTVGDEFPAVAGSQAGSRMWMAKTALNNVVTRYSDRINFGLASYKQGDASSNVQVISPPPSSWYYTQDWAQYPFNTNQTVGNRYYPAPWDFDLTVPIAGLGGPANASDPAGYNPATLRPNSPSFTLTWKLPSSPTVNRGCRWDWQISYDNGKTWSYWWTDYYWNTTDCTAGTVRDLTKVPAQTETAKCTYAYKKTYDDPNPYVYNCNYYYNGSFDYSGTEQWPTYQGSSYSYTVWSNPAYWYERVAQYVVRSWSYFYYATCKLNCKNTGTFWPWEWDSPWYRESSPCNASKVNNPYTDPPKYNLPTCAEDGSSWTNSAGKAVWVPTATGGYTAPFDIVYNWQGNNYKLATDTSCDPSGGGQILADVGSGNLGKIQNFLGTGSDPTKELHAANHSTPLAGALQTALAYFTDPNGAVQTDSQKNCRSNFILLVTDGGESCLIDLTQPGKYAQQLASLSNPPGGVTTFVVGIDQGGLMDDEKTVLNDIGAKGGTGKWYSASDPASLQATLDTVLGQALTLSRSYSFSPVVIPRTRVQNGMMALQPSLFLPVPDPATQKLPTFWPGTLTAYQMQGDGTLATDSAKTITATIYWDAGAVLNATSPSARNMFIGLADNLGGGMAQFALGNTNVYKAIGCMNPSGAYTSTTNFPDMDGSGAITQSDCDTFISLLQGDGSQGWLGKLGDVFHSQVVLVGDPSPTYVDNSIDASTGQVLGQSQASSTFAAFRTAKQADGTRIRLAVVGANDGFLHAFNAGTWNSSLGSFDTGTGAEVWAYSPPNFYNSTTFRSTLTNLATQLGAHTYYVDGTAKVFDVWLDDNNDNVKAADGSEWHTVALVNLRQGGAGIFHLDLTDRKNPKPISNGPTAYPAFYPTCGYSWSEPAIGKVKVLIGGKKVDRWVAFFGDGDSGPVGASATCGKRFYVVDIKTGNSLWEVGPTNDSNMKYDLIGSPIALDLDGDGYVDRVYIGDRGGQIWRFDVSAIATNSGGNVVPGPAGGASTKWVTNWLVSRLYDDRQGRTCACSVLSFYEKPAAALDEKGNVWVFAGTGDRLNPLSAGTPDSDSPVVSGKGEEGRLFGIKETYPAQVTPWGFNDIQDVTGTNTLDPSSLSKAGGWKIKLDQGEKNFTATDVFNKTVFFGTVLPGTVTGACGINQISARLYMVHYLTGGGITDVVSYKSSTPTPSDRYVTLGSGAPTRAIISTLSLGGGGILLAGTSDQIVRLGTSSGGDIPFNAPTNLRLTRYWRMN